MALAEVAKVQKQLIYRLADELVDGKITLKEFFQGVLTVPIPAVVASALYENQKGGSE
jgi:hypothetical protein